MIQGVVENDAVAIVMIIAAGIRTSFITVDPLNFSYLKEKSHAPTTKNPKSYPSSSTKIS